MLAAFEHSFLILHQSVVCMQGLFTSQQPLICFVTLNRAGDTIVLEAGQIHHAHDVVIPWPLKLVGSGADAEDTMILCSKGPDAALDFRCGMPILVTAFCMSKAVPDMPNSPLVQTP